MNKVSFLIALTLASVSALAQKSFDDEVNSELDKMYSQGQVQAPQAQNVAPAIPAQPSSVQVNVQQPPSVQAPYAQPQAYTQAPTYSQAPAYNQVPAAVQKQPTTVIEASPLQESRVEKMRRARQESELQTEQKIVEKLELSRIEDEHRRAEVLFGDKFNQLSNAQNQVPVQPPVYAQQPPPQQAPVYVAPPVETVVATPVNNEEKLDRESVREEISAALDEKEAQKNVTDKKTYMSLLGGVGLYNNTNIQSQYALGVGLGEKVNDHLMFEGQFIYSDYHVQLPFNSVRYNAFYPTFYPVTTDMKQYQGIANLKYALFSGNLRPIVGAAGAYTYRSYDASQFGYTNFGSTSNAFDVGLLAGVDLEMGNNFALGFEARYMWNMYYQTQSNNGVISALSGVTPETVGYSIIGVTGRITF